MHVEYRKEYSHNLGRDMEYKIFGHSGHSILVIPTQDKRFFEYEDEGMVGAVQYWIDRGDIRLICADAIDQETWSNTWGDCRWRLEQHERWFRYITEELVPRVRRGDETFIVTGCSLGGFHAANMFFRRPDLSATTTTTSPGSTRRRTISPGRTTRIPSGSPAAGGRWCSASGRAPGSTGPLTRRGRWPEYSGATTQARGLTSGAMTSPMTGRGGGSRCPTS